MPGLTGLDHLVLTVTDITDTVRFYREVLGMEVVRFQAGDGTERVALKFGSQKINLHRATEEFLPKALVPTPGSADLCFVTGTPLADWLAKLAKLRQTPLAGPVARSGAMGKITSIYLRDPDGNLIEISIYD